MTNNKDGGPAFPLSGYSPHEQFGMTLRDWFAGQALSRRRSDGIAINLADLYAKEAYLIADAMLKARDNGTS